MTTTMTWRDADAAVEDDEVTRLTESAHEWALARAREQFGSAESETVGASLRLRVPAGDDFYLAEVRGQSTYTGHGRQGSHPTRLNWLAGLGLPALLVYADARRVDYGWLHRLPEAIRIDVRLGHLRWGWWVKDMENSDREAFRFPVEVPAMTGSRAVHIPDQLFGT